MTIYTVPIGSIGFLDEAKAEEYATRALGTPNQVRELIFSARTGAYIKGLAKNNNIEAELAPKLSFLILRLMLGEVRVNELGVALSSELKIANDKAQAMAKEIEHDLIAPVAMELNQYLEKKKQETSAAAKASASQAGAKNVLDLKSQARPPRPPEMPTRNP